MKKLAIITTHPIQYYAPVFKLLHQREKISIKVFYTWGESALKKFDPGFGKVVDWDVPLLDGYEYEWADNTANDPGSHHFKGIINPGLVQQIEAWQPDAVLVFGWAYYSHLKALRHFKNKIPVYFRGDSTLLDEKDGLKQSLRSVFLKWIYRHVDHAFYTGINNKAYFKKYGLKDEQLSFAPHAVDNDRFEIEQKDEVLRLKEELQIKIDDLVILFAGMLEEKKSPGLLLDAFFLLDDPAMHLVFSGAGVLEKELKERAKDNRNVYFIGFQNQSAMPVVCQACDLFCLPSKGPGETWGLAVNEAMVCGKPVLVSDKCGCAIDLVADENGMIFKNEDIDDLTACLKKMTTDREKLAILGNASKKIIKNWNFVNIAQAIEAEVNMGNG